MELSERLVRLRKQKGLSQFDVTETLHVSRQAISKWESGNSFPSTDNLFLLGIFMDQMEQTGTVEVLQHTQNVLSTIIVQ